MPTLLPSYITEFPQDITEERFITVLKHQTLTGNLEWQLDGQTYWAERNGIKFRIEYPAKQDRLVINYRGEEFDRINVGLVRELFETVRSCDRERLRNHPGPKEPTAADPQMFT